MLLFLVLAPALATVAYLYSLVMSSTPSSRQYKLFGTPIQHSLSPLFHNAVFDALDLPHRYERHETPTFSDDPSILALLRPPPAEASIFAFSGAAVTMPYKTAVLPFMDELGSEVQEIGAMNTVVRGEGGRLVGRNTDVDGIREALLSTRGEEERGREKPFGAGRSAFIIGGGGTTRAAIYALSQLSLSPIYLLNRDASETASIISTPAFAKYDLRPLDDDVLASWTEEDTKNVVCAVGAIPSFEPQTEGEKMVYRVAEGIFERTGKLEGRRPIMEMAYKPHQTLIYKLAQKHGWSPIGGIEALIHQATTQQRYWLIDSPVTRVPGLTEEKLREAVEVAARKVREAAGAPVV